MIIFLRLLLKLRFMFLRVPSNREFPSPLDSETEAEYIRKKENGDKDARNKLIEHNLRLVAHIIKKYYSQNKNQDDLASIGTIGLIKAIDSFSTKNGVKLATYASKCIQNEILMHFRSNKKLSQEVSLNETIDIDKEGNPLTYQDVVYSEDNIAEELDLKMSSEKVYKIIREYLSQREREIIILRYGLINGNIMTQNQIAQKMGISRSYISRIEKAAIEKIKYRMTVSEKD